MSESTHSFFINKAVVIESKYQFNSFKTLCLENGINICDKSYSGEHYEMLCNAGGRWFSLPNTELENSPDSVHEKGFIVITLKQFKEHVIEARPSSILIKKAKEETGYYNL